jgi:hypothetical protein
LVFFPLPLIFFRFPLFSRPGLTFKGFHFGVRSFLADGLLTLKGTDYASDYLLSIKDNKITQVVETPLGDNVACYGSKAVLTKTYVLSAPEITAYAE